MDSPVIRNSLPSVAERLRLFQAEIAKLPAESKAAINFREGARYLIGGAISSVDRVVQELKFYENAVDREKQDE